MKFWREDCLERLSSQKSSPAEILKALASIVGELGFEYCSYVLRVPYPTGEPVVTWSSTYPSRWLDHYFANNYLESDPLILQAFEDTGPVVWDGNLRTGQPGFWEEARGHGVAHGWAIGTHGRQMTTGMLSLARSAEKVTSLELSEKEPQLVWLSHLTHGLICAVETQKIRADIDQKLTDREVEVLRWSAGGKTADEIGTILSISPRTVTFHITSSLAKLNSTNKTQAVAKALFLGLL